ncbi:MAG: hypothetical protein IJ087_19220, partial [Eggerthellaceae bacterium]|nr:hypothetical protein [Eggerthellaceae bacterium]
LPDGVKSFASDVDSDGKVIAILKIPSTAEDIPEGVREITLPVTVKSEKNYEDSTINVVMVPTKREEMTVTIAGVPTAAKTYGDDAFALTATVKDEQGNPVTTQDDDWYWYSSNPSVLAVDTEDVSNQMRVRVMGAGSAQILAWYEPSGDDTIGAALTEPITVNKAGINPSVSIDGRTYGDAAKTPVVNGNTGNGAVTYSYSGTTRGETDFGPSASAPTQAGAYTVTATVAETDNYLGGTCTKEFTITPKSVPVIVIAEDKTYDGTTNANVIATMKSSDLVEGDLIEDAVYDGDGNVMFPGLAGTFDDANAGQDKPITLDDSKVTYPVAETSNYEAAISEAPAATIKPLTVYVNADDKSGRYGESISELTFRPYDPTELVEGDTLESLGITVSTTAASSSDAGEYPITLSGGKANSNYDVQLGDDGTYTITKADNSAEVSIENWVYGESAKQPQVTADFGADTATIEYKAKDADDAMYSGTVPTEPGEYTVRATVPDTDNYDGATATADFTIKPVVTFDANEGSGTKDDEVVEFGSTYTLPAADTFGTPEGKCRFASWEVTIGSAEPVRKNPSETITITANTTVKALWEDHNWGEWTQTKAPTCVAVGEEEHVCSRDGLHKETREVAIDPNAHDWGEPTYEWATDNSTLTATRICGRSSEHVETETVGATEELVPPTAAEPGKRTWMSDAFENPAFEAQTKGEVIDALGELAVANGDQQQWIAGKPATIWATASELDLADGEVVTEWAWEYTKTPGDEGSWKRSGAKTSVSADSATCSLAIPECTAARRAARSWRATASTSLGRSAISAPQSLSEDPVLPVAADGEFAWVEGQPVDIKAKISGLADGEQVASWTWYYSSGGETFKKSGAQSSADGDVLTIKIPKCTQARKAPMAWSVRVTTTDGRTATSDGISLVG